MGRAKRTFIAAFVAFGVIVGTGVVIRDIYAGEAINSQPGNLFHGKATNKETNDFAINAIVGGGATLSLLLGGIYWVFGLLDAKSQLESEKNQQEVFKEMLDETIQDINCSQQRCLVEKQDLTVRIAHLEKIITKESANSAKIFFQLQQNISTNHKDLIHHKELIAVEIEKLESMMSDIHPILFDAFNKINQMENFLSKNYANYSVRSQNKIGPFYKQRTSHESLPQIPPVD